MEEQLSMSSIPGSVDSDMHLLLNASGPVKVVVLLVALASPLMVLPGWGLFRLPFYWMTEDAFCLWGSSFPCVTA